MADSSEPDLKQVPLAWVGAEEVPVLFSNQVLAQLDDAGEILLSFGQAAPPVLLGTEEQKREQLENIGWVPVRAVARVAMNRSRIEQLLRLLNETLKHHDRQQQLLDQQKQKQKREGE